MSEKEFDETATLQGEFNTLAQQQEQIGQQYQSVEAALNAGQIGLEEGNHARIELKNAYERNTGRLTELYGSLSQVRTEELNNLSQTIPGWETEHGRREGQGRLQKFLKDEGYPDNFVGTASVKQLRDLEELRQRRSLKKGDVTDMDMQAVMAEAGKEYKKDPTDWNKLSDQSGIPAARLKTMKKSDRDWMTKDLGDIPG